MPEPPASGKPAGPDARRLFVAAALMLFGMAALGAWLSRDLEGRIAAGRQLESETGKPVGPERLQAPRDAAAAEGVPPNPDAFRRFLLYGVPLYVGMLAAGIWAWRGYHRRMTAAAAAGDAP